MKLAFKMQSCIDIAPATKSYSYIRFSVFAGNELTNGTVEFEWKMPLLAPSYCDRLTMEEACQSKGNTQIEM
jgi:hypothetical protein